MWMWVIAAAWAGFLSHAVKQELRDPALDGAAVSVQVLNHRGRSVVDWNGGMRLVPASTVKWITAVAAADLLGLDHRFETRFAVSGYLSGDTVVGDLVLIGSGDPSMAGPGEVFPDAVAALRDAGIRRVEGSVIVADDGIGDGPLGAGWMWDDLRFDFSAPFGSINLGHNMAQRGLEMCDLVEAGRRSPIADPDACAAQALLEALRVGGVWVSGGARVGERPEGPLTDLVVWDSAPLRELLEIMLQSSDNLYAECIVRALDRQGVRTFRGARPALERVLERAGVSGVHVADGSGLSRYSMVSAEALARLTHWALLQPYGNELMPLLAQMGRTGTLQRRGVGTPAEGRVWGKTGSMTGVRNITGVAYDERGKPVRFAVLFNGLTVPRQVAIRLQDRIVSLIAVSRRQWVRRKDRIAVQAEGG